MVLRRSRSARERLNKFCKDFQQSGNGSEIVIWEYRSDSNDYQVIASSSEVVLDCDGEQCIPGATRAAGFLSSDLNLMRGKALYDNIKIYLVDEYSRLAWRAFCSKSIKIVHKDIKDDHHIVAIFSKRQGAFRSIPVQKSIKVTFRCVEEIISLLQEAEVSREKDKRINKNLFKVNAAEVAKQFLHDIKDYLHEMDDPIQILKKRECVSENEYKSADLQIQNYLSEAKELTTAFLQRARENRLKIERFYVSDVCSRTLTDFRLRCRRKGVIFRDHITKTNHTMNVDKYHFTSVLFNVMNNALYFCDKGGRSPCIEVSFEYYWSDTLSAMIVYDNGPGISDPAKAVEAGFTTRKSGTGFGLALAKDTMLKHGGDLVIQSSLGQYTRVILVLPHHD